MSITLELFRFITRKKQCLFRLGGPWEPVQGSSNPSTTLASTSIVLVLQSNGHFQAPHRTNFWYSFKFMNLHKSSRLERHQKTIERAQQALKEKNERDKAQLMEQAEKSRSSENLDAEIRRWATARRATYEPCCRRCTWCCGRRRTGSRCRWRTEQHLQSSFELHLSPLRQQLPKSLPATLAEEPSQQHPIVVRARMQQPSAKHFDRFNTPIDQTLRSSQQKPISATAPHSWTQ